MYPFPTRARWLIAGRYSHFVQALGQEKDVHDPTLAARLREMALWNKVRAVVLVLLSLGIAATLATAVANFLPAFNDAAALVDRLTAAASAVSSALTLVYIVLTRLLGQIEADILCVLGILGARRPGSHSPG